MKGRGRLGRPSAVLSVPKVLPDVDISEKNSVFPVLRVGFLRSVVSGDLAATRRVAGMVADALEFMGSLSDSCATEIRRALDEGGKS